NTLGDVIQDKSILVVNSPAVVNLPFFALETIGGLSGDGTVAFREDNNSESLTIGGIFANSDTTFAGSLNGNDLLNGTNPQDVLIKDGSGTLTLSGNNGFTGRIRVDKGKLFVNGSTAASIRDVSVFSGSVLGGTGVINRPINIDMGGHLAPGAGTG